ncbi:MAG: EamA family transporter [Campylobacteraceae bacterium]|jgi:carboxylate/amino acid/amine transporter|nr:EamA family transporter [Campylobacteraceae bacterium]
MIYLIIVTVLWAFSVSLIGEYLVGLDSYFLVFLRVFLASLIFIPFTKFKGVFKKLQISLLLIGSVQIGIMYLCLYHSYRFLTVPEILLFTIFTPFYVTIIYDILHKQFNALYLVSAFVAVLGAYIIRYQNVNSDFLIGFIFVQAANICFAIGQSAYKYTIEKYQVSDQKEIFGYFHFGALIITAVAVLALGNFEKMNPSELQWGILIWLGVVASGIGYFLWNKGATMVDAGTLAIMNNALIPAGIFVNILFWGKVENYVSLSIGTAVIIFSLWLHAKFVKLKKSKPIS